MGGLIALRDLSALLVELVFDFLKLSSKDLLLVFHSILFTYFNHRQLYVGSSRRFRVRFRLLTFEHRGH